MKIKPFIICICLWLGIGSAVIAQDTLTVITYNIYHAESVTDSGQSTLKEIAQFIAAKDPDFVALQEVDSASVRLAGINGGRSFSLADSLAKLTNMVGYFGKAIDFQNGGYGIAILGKKPVEYRKIELPNPQKGEPRVLLTVQAENSSGRSFIFANTHLDHQHEENRLAQLKAINASLIDSEIPVILAGDFNFEPDSRGYAKMQDNWKDAATESATINVAFTFPSSKPEKRIDYIWLSKNLEWKVLEFETPDIAFSDHRPVVAKVVIL